MVSPFRKPNDINESRHPSGRNQQGYERRAAEPEITKEYIKMDQMRESVVTEENEEVEEQSERTQGHQESVNVLWLLLSS